MIGFLEPSILRGSAAPLRTKTSRSAIDACTLACGANVCGDGKAWLGVEPCDDGNTASGDGCRGDCRKVEACGDSEVDAGEGCDDGAARADFQGHRSRD